MPADSNERRWYRFNYNNGGRISLHYVRPSLVARVQRFVEKCQLDLVITEMGR